MNKFIYFILILFYFRLNNQNNFDRDNYDENLKANDLSEVMGELDFIKKNSDIKTSNVSSTRKLSEITALSAKIGLKQTKKTLKELLG